MRQTGESYTVALAAERRTRPPPRKRASTEGDSRDKEVEMSAEPVAATRLRGTWMGVTSFDRSRGSYERLGAYFDAAEPVDGIVSATLGGTRLIFEAGHGTGPFLLFDVTDADACMPSCRPKASRSRVRPRDEQWGRQFNVRDPDGHSIAFLGPIR
jgi:hypothetical protein